MKVRAKEPGQYKGRHYDIGSVFDIEDGTYPVFEVDDYSRPILEDGKPVIREQRPHLEHWMEKIDSEPKKKGWLS